MESQRKTEGLFQVGDLSNMMTKGKTWVLYCILLLGQQLKWSL